MAMARAIPTYEDLREENIWLREQLGMEIAAEKVARVTRAWGLTTSQAHLLLLLHARRGRVATYAFLEQNIPSGRGVAGDRCPQILSVWLSRIRKKLGADLITTHTGAGLSAPPATLARIDALFEDLP